MEEHWTPSEQCLPLFLLERCRQQLIGRHYVVVKRLVKRLVYRRRRPALERLVVT
jgi:hypothetical protein